MRGTGSGAKRVLRSERKKILGVALKRRTSDLPSCNCKRRNTKPWSSDPALIKSLCRFLPLLKRNLTRDFEDIRPRQGFRHPPVLPLYATTMGTSGSHSTPPSRPLPPSPNFPGCAETTGPKGQPEDQKKTSPFSLFFSSLFFLSRLPEGHRTGRGSPRNKAKMNLPTFFLFSSSLFFVVNFTFTTLQRVNQVWKCILTQVTFQSKLPCKG